MSDDNLIQDNQDLEVIRALARVLQGGNEFQEQKYKSVTVKRLDEPTIAIPRHMSLPTAATWLTKVAKEEEAMVNVYHEIDCYPLDGAVAFHRACLDIYGITESVVARSFFGDKPPTMVSVRTGPGPKEFVQVPWGRLRVPGLEDPEYLSTGMETEGGRPRFIIGGQVRKKNEMMVAGIAGATALFLRESSIYQGKALRVDLSWIEDESFDPMADGPEFMDVSSVSPDQLILNPAVELAVQGNIFGFILHTDAYLATGEPLSGGVLLAGKPGTGKTLTARVLARLCQEHNWTFLYLKNVRHLAHALHLADMYETKTRGVVVFAEDIDRATSGQRTSEIDAILNTISGVDRPGKKTLTVVTTNDPHAIHHAMLRAGRMDSFIEFDYPQGETVIRFIRHYAGESLADSQDFGPVAEAANNFPPSFIEAVVRRARRYAIGQYGAAIQGKVTADMLLSAAISYQEHVKLAAAPEPDTSDDHVGRAIAQAVVEHIKEDGVAQVVSERVWADRNTGKANTYK